MSREELESVPLPLEYKKLEKILTLDPRVFKPCEGKEVAQWSWRRLKTEKWLVHLTKYTNKWKIRRLS